MYSKYSKTKIKTLVSKSKQVKYCCQSTKIAIEVIYKRAISKITANSKMKVSEQKLTRRQMVRLFCPRAWWQQLISRSSSPAHLYRGAHSLYNSNINSKWKNSIKGFSMKASICERFSTWMRTAQAMKKLLLM